MPSGAGVYDKLVQFQARGAAEHGQEEGDWTTFLECKAGFKTMQGREGMFAKQVRPEQTHIVTIRWGPDRVITPEHRLIYGNRVFHIEAAANVDEQNREIRIDCTEIPGEQA